jgi:hypothetical protein
VKASCSSENDLRGRSSLKPEGSSSSIATDR